MNPVVIIVHTWKKVNLDKIKFSRFTFSFIVLVL